MNACQSNCNQGRSKCPTPAACQLPEEDYDQLEGAGVILTPLAVIALIAVVSMIVSVMP
jgi:hypothetical protein